VPARGRRCRGRCGRASGGGTVYDGSRKKASAAAVAELPAAPVLPRVGLGFVGWGVWRHGEPRTASRGPHPLFIALCDAGPPTMDWLGAPTRARERARYDHWAVTEERSNLHSPSRSLLQHSLNLEFLTWHPLHHK
jgi:hypothetical protein